jgi:hypothetical protein
MEHGRDAGVYAGSGSLWLQVFGRRFGSGDPMERCGFARLRVACCDTRSTLVMKGSPVRVRASASLITLQKDSFELFHTTGEPPNGARYRNRSFSA